MVYYILIGLLLVALIVVRLFGRGSAKDKAKRDLQNENRKRLRDFEKASNFFKYVDAEKVKTYVSLLSTRHEMDSYSTETRNRIAKCISKLIPYYLETVEDYKSNRLPSQGVEKLITASKEVKSEIKNDFDSFTVVVVVMVGLTNKLKKDSNFLTNEEKQRNLKRNIKEIDNALV